MAHNMGFRASNERAKLSMADMKKSPAVRPGLRYKTSTVDDTSVSKARYPREPRMSDRTCAQAANGLPYFDTVSANRLLIGSNVVVASLKPSCWNFTAAFMNVSTLLLARSA